AGSGRAQWLALERGRTGGGPGGTTGGAPDEVRPAAQRPGASRRPAHPAGAAATHRTAGLHRLRHIDGRTSHRGDQSVTKVGSWTAGSSESRTSTASRAPSTGSVG